MNKRLFIPTVALTILLLPNCNEPNTKKMANQTTEPQKQDNNNNDPNQNNDNYNQSGITTPKHADTGDIISSEECDKTYDEKCQNNIAYFCDETGYKATRDCNKLNSFCHKLAEDNIVDCVDECQPDTFKEYTSCDGDYVSIHNCMEGNDGKYYDYSFTNEPCFYGCKDGKCIEPAENSACDAGKYVTHCVNNNYYLCENGKLVKTSCTGQKECTVMPGNTIPQCAKPCRTVAESTYGCNGKNLDNYECIPDTETSYHLFHITTACNDYCKDGVCDHVIPHKNAGCDYETDIDLCANNTLYFCSSETDKIETMTCGLGDYVSSPYCRTKAGGKYADCVAGLCTKGAEGYTDCSTATDSAGTEFDYSYGIVCQKATDGQYYWFNFEERCTGDCNKPTGKCL